MGVATARSRTRCNPGRVAAAKALVRIEEGAHGEVVLDELLPEGRDRSLGWFLTFGVLRRRARIDAALNPFLRAPLAGLDPEVRAVLRLGAFEVLFARTRMHAAVNEAVEVVRALGNKRATGLVNAVLRRVVLPEGLSRADSLDHPPWLVERWDARYGVEATEAWCLSAGEPPPLIAVLRDPSLAEQLAGAERTVSEVHVRGAPLAGVVRVDGHRGPVTELPGFSSGAFWLQDAASVAVADRVAVGLTPGARVLDACAAPGGKSFRLAAAGARVTAVDLVPDRLATVREGAARLGVELDLVEHDWTTGACHRLPRFERVLVDAPCTGLGTLRRHPEIRWRRHEHDLDRASHRQRAILAGAAEHLAPGGELVYAVCSVEPEEGREVVAAFLASRPDVHLVEAWETAPPREGEDAHYAAVIRRAFGSAGRRVPPPEVA